MRLGRGLKRGVQEAGVLDKALSGDFSLILNCQHAEPSANPSQAVESTDQFLSC